MTSLTLPEWNTHTLTIYRGQPLLVLFFNIGCDGCMTRALPVAVEIVRQYPGIQVIGVHAALGAFGRDPEQVAIALSQFALNFPVVLDNESTAYKTYQAEGTPHWIFMDANGEVIKSIFGSQPNALQRIEYTLIEMFGNHSVPASFVGQS